MNVLSMHALMGAYTPEGQKWAVGELLRSDRGNVAMHVIISTNI